MAVTMHTVQLEQIGPIQAIDRIRDISKWASKNKIGFDDINIAYTCVQFTDPKTATFFKLSYCNDDNRH